MKAWQRATDWDVVNGTSLRGHININYASLVEIFGEPERWAAGDKVQAEWVLVFTDPVSDATTVATIYDWKQYGVDPERVVDWHIGGHTNDAEHCVRIAIDEFFRQRETV